MYKDTNYLPSSSAAMTRPDRVDTQLALAYTYDESGEVNGRETVVELLIGSWNGSNTTVTTLSVEAAKQAIADLTRAVEAVQEREGAAR